MSPFVDVEVDRDRPGTTGVLGDDDLCTALVQVGDDGVAVEGFIGDEPPEFEAFDERLPSAAVIVAAAATAGVRDPAGFAALALTILAYGSFWLATVTIVALFARRSTEAAIAVGSIWLLVVVMAPSLTLTTVDLLAEPPSEMRFSTELKDQLTQITERQRRDREAGSPPTRKPMPGSPDQMRAFYAQAVATDLELTPMIAAHRRVWDERRRLLDHVRLFLPSVAVQDALDRIAGSDADRALAFQDQVVAFRQERRLLYREYLDRGSAQTVAEYDNLPRFVITHPPCG